MAVIKNTVNDKVGEEIEKLDPSYFVSENVKWCSHFGKYSDSSSNSLTKRFIWHSNSTPKRNENKCLHQNLYTDVHCSFSLSSQKTETIQMFLNW